MRYLINQCLVWDFSAEQKVSFYLNPQNQKKVFQKERNLQKNDS